MPEEIPSKYPARFIFVITPELRHEVKMRAAMRNISMSLWVTRAIYEQLKKEKQYDLKP